IISQSPGKVVLRNFEGVITTYTEPMNYSNECECDIDFLKEEEMADGVASLLHGDRLSLEPSQLARHDRIKKN
ncbi:MAG: lysine 2,3-aminomutase, partial [Bacteroidales bacterium]|nr:lysine 2,3-aminomutase [Bacteroidales bacterium]